MKHLRLSFFVAAIFCSATSRLFGQSQYRFENYTSVDGLGNDRVVNLEQDSLGYIWIQYYGVITSFDGYNFKVYRYNEKDSLTSALDFLLGWPFKDDANNIWITRHKGGPTEWLVKYDRKTDGFVKYEIEVDGVGVDGRLFESGGTEVWLGTFGKGLYKHNFLTGKTERFQNQNSDVYRQRNWITGMKDLGSTLLLSTWQGLWVFNKKDKTFSRPPCNSADTASLFNSFTRIQSNSKKSDPSTWLKEADKNNLIQLDSNFSIIHRFDPPEGVFIERGFFDIDKEGVVWFVGPFEGKAGLYRYDPRDRSLINLKHDPENPNSLPSDNVYDVMVDSDQNVWVGTDHGLGVLRKPSLTFYNESIKGGTLYASTLYKAKDAEYLVSNNLFTATGPNENHIMMARLIPGRPDSIHLQPVLKPLTNSSDSFVQQLYQGRNYFWIVQFPVGIFGYPIDQKTGMFYQTNPKELFPDPDNPNKIRGVGGNVMEDTRGNLLNLVGLGIDIISPSLNYGDNGSVRRITIKEPNEFIYRRDEKSFWTMDMNSKSIGIFHEDSDSIEQVFHLKEMVYSLRQSSRGTLLVGTQNGLYEAYQENGKYKLGSEPLIPNEVNAIQEDKLGRIWIYANDRIICYDRTSKTTTFFNEEDGLEHCHTVYNDWLHQTADGIMIAADPNGVSVFDPSSFKFSQEKVNPVLIRLDINNTNSIGKKLPGEDDFVVPAAISVLNDLIIDYKHNNFTIEFSAMKMVAPSKNLYRHQLEGYDKDWIETDYKNRTATYTNLPEGTYTFRVKASNHHGVWSDQERTLKVIILPPPWRTWWAYTGYGLIVVGLLVMARRNIVQRERLKSNLAVAKVEQEKEHFELEKAKEVDKVKTSFFTNISHEFRTPLTLIKGPVQDLLEKYTSDPKTQQKLKLVQRNSDLLLKLINQLLDLAKLESGTLKVEKSEGDLYSFIRAIASSFSSFAAQKNITVHVDVPADSCQANFDKDKLETILINLINNAIKFTPANGLVTVTAVLRLDTYVLILQVKDTGIGISEEHQSKIFERFHQVSEAHKEVGTGIGLSLVKELVELMKGNISVKSEIGKGSEFTVVLHMELLNEVDQVFEVTTERVASHQPAWPVGRLPVTGDRQLATEGNPLQKGDDTKPHILVVEDNTDLRHFIIDSLGNEFYFLEAENGKIGLNIATTEVPDLIVSDVMMPEMDGITMAGKIKKDIRTSHIPLILLTAKSTEDSKLSGLQSGADDYLTKPFNKQELLLKVRNGVSRQIKLRERLRAELMSTAPKVEVLSEDERFLNSVKEKILERLSDEQLSVESLAEDMGMSRVQLYRKVSGLTDISVNELIRKLRLQRAAQLLSQNWGPVSQVAYEVGFSNLSYFSKVFKEEFGVLPSEYVEKS